ncbi:MAG: alpha/beta hydrolase [Rhodoferax sp.]|jgi:pimeloyl-ACP methyl ester carboxylesterase|nr:alpha/beta hydrolase [Rhodoferax sp.]
MADFLLVHGAWHGAWCWRAVVPALVQAGHRVHALTLTGLGERAHLLHAGIDLQTHIQDVAQAIEAEEMQQLVLVGHSYAGMLVTAIADRMPERLSHLVYVDAVVPKPGESWSSTHAPATRKARLAAAQASPLFAFPPPDPGMFGLSGPDHAWVVRRQTAHPGHTYEAPLDFDVRRVGGVRRTFISCTAPALATIDAIRPRVGSASFWDGAWLPGARVVELKTGHDPMISAPQALVDILQGCC